MKINIDIILGFLESGKTNFINYTLKNNTFKNETIVIIQDESGKTTIDSASCMNNNNIIVIQVKKSDEKLDTFFIKKIIKTYAPNRIFIEANGMKNPSSILNIFNDKYIKKACKIDDIITIIDAENFYIYLNNIKSIMTSDIFNCDTIILNNIDNLDNLDKKQYSNIQKEIREINETVNIIEHTNIPNEEYLEITKRSDSFSIKILVYPTLFILLLTLLGILQVSGYNIPNVFDAFKNNFSNFYTVFISILIQGFPFILFGSFVSAIIQICISKNILMKLFSKNIFLSCLIAAFAGLLFPICDCGTIPVVKSLIKKKVPIAAAITFMLAAPIVNPISIFSTVYAFNGMKSVVFCRIFIGIIVAILVGLIIQLLTKKEDTILTISSDEHNCDCVICHCEEGKLDNTFKKLKAIFIHTGNEFINTGKFMIIGTFLSSIFQIVLSSNNNIYISNNNKISLFIMMLLSFLLSVCSTSDAFIARSFLNIFPTSSIMGFLVLGPMIDIKNTSMLLGNFKKKFVFKLIFLIFTISFTILINIRFCFK